MLNLPKRPWPIWLLAICLSLSSSPRSMDIAALGYMANQWGPNDNGVMPGALLASFITVPMTLVICYFSLQNYPKERTSLFFFSLSPRQTQISINLIFLFLAGGSLLLTVDCARLALSLPTHEKDLAEFTADTWWNTIASTGWIALWLSLRSTCSKKLTPADNTP